MWIMGLISGCFLSFFILISCLRVDKNQQKNQENCLGARDTFFQIIEI